MSRFSESVVEDAALEWLEALGWRLVHGPDVAPETLAAERTSYGEVVLARRLRDALGRLNPQLPAEALDDAFRKVTRPEAPTLEHLRVLVKRILRKYGYPPDKQEKATQTVLEQAEVLSQEWAMA